MKPQTTLRQVPLAAALAFGSVLLVGMTACNRKPAETTPPVSATAATPAPATMAPPAATTTAMGSDMGAAPAASTSASAMGAASSEITSGPITDTQFFTQAMQGDQKEIATGKMVTSQSSNADIQHLANKIMGDHQAFDKKVQSAAGSGVTPPTGQVDPALQGLTGKDLDKAYADAMVADHQKDIPMFENAAKNASTAKARSLASSALPTLREHLKMAQDVQKKLASS